MSLLLEVIEPKLSDLALQSDEIDFLIIGSGTAGVTSAIELAQAGAKVVILEAGPYVMMNHIGTSPLRVRGEIVSEIERRITFGTSWVTNKEYSVAMGPGGYPRNNTTWSNVGGRTLFWGGLTPRFNDFDFDDWPIDYEQFIPYYVKAETLIGVSSTTKQRPAFIDSAIQETFIEKFRKQNIPAEKPPLAVDTSEIKNGRISNGFDSSISRLLRSGFISKELKTKSIVFISQTVALDLIAKGDSVECVQVLDKRENKTYDLKPKHIVLACGAIQSTRLVSTSKIDYHSNLVGKYINDHLFIQGLIKLNNPIANEPCYLFLPSHQKQPYQFQIQGPFHETWYNPNFATIWLDWQKESQYLLLYGFGIASMEKNNRLEIFERKYDPYAGLQNHLIVYDRSRHDEKILKAMHESAKQIAETFNGELVRCDTNDPGKALHEIGGLRMGHHPKNSVTDPFGHFWRMNNLSVADAAAWPSQSAANSYLTITAFSLWHADNLIRKYKNKDNT